MGAQIGLRVLIADDNRDLAENLSEILGASGHDSVVVFDGESAVDRVSHDRFDMVVLDITMPRKDGIATCSELHLRHPALPVILITGYEHSTERTALAGATAVLTKPLDIDQLLVLIDQFSRSRTG